MGNSLSVCKYLYDLRACFFARNEAHGKANDCSDYHLEIFFHIFHIGPPLYTTPVQSLGLRITHGYTGNNTLCLHAPHIELKYEKFSKKDTGQLNRYLFNLFI